MATVLERDAAMALPIVDQLAGDIAGDATGNLAGDASGAPSGASPTRVLDLGCGPGVLTMALARVAPDAEVVAVDTNEALLARVRAHAVAEGLDARVHTVVADIESPLSDHPLLGGPAGSDAVWVSMVMHHVADPVAVLGEIRELLRPGGAAVLVEFAGPPEVVGVDDPAAAAWGRLEAAVSAARNERLGLDPLALDWSALVTASGLVDVDDRVLVARHEAPLGAEARHWVRAHIERSLEWVGDALSADDVAALQALAAEADDRVDLFVRVERRAITAHRPS